MLIILFYIIINIPIYVKGNLDDYCVIFENSNKYVGKISETISGKGCIKWTNVSIRFGLTNGMFPDGIVNAKNYCRNPGQSEKMPFCYTKESEGKEKEECDIPVCTNVEMLGYTSQLSTFPGHESYNAFNSTCSQTLSISRNWTIRFPEKFNFVFINFTTTSIMPSTDDFIIIIESGFLKTGPCEVKKVDTYTFSYKCNARIDEITIHGVRQPLILCNLIIIGGFKPTYCISHGTSQGYNGIVSNTRNSKQCIKWEKLKKYVPENAFLYSVYPENYCRSLLDPVGPWCFTITQTNVYQKQYCLVKSCKSMEFNCLFDKIGADYGGQWSHAKTGEICMNWIDAARYYVIPDTLSLTLLNKSSNFCRNFDNDRSGPWCYTTSYGYPKRHCNVPICRLIYPRPNCKSISTLTPITYDCMGPDITSSDCRSPLSLPYDIVFIEPILIEVVIVSGKNIQNIMAKLDNKDDCAEYNSDTKSDILINIKLKCEHFGKKLEIVSTKNPASFTLCRIEVYTMPPPIKYFGINSWLDRLGYEGWYSRLQCLQWNTVKQFPKSSYLMRNNDIYLAFNYYRGDIIEGNLACIISTFGPSYTVEVLETQDVKLADYHWYPSCKNVTNFLCYGLWLNKKKPCSIIHSGELMVNKSDKLGEPLSMSLFHAFEDEYYTILLLTFQGLTLSYDNLQIHYLATHIQGFDLRNEIFPMRKIEILKLENPIPPGKLIALVLQLHNNSFNMFNLVMKNCSFQKIQEFGVFTFVTSSLYTVV